MSVPPLSFELAHEVLEYLGVDTAPPIKADAPLLDALVDAYTRTVPWESAFRIAKRTRTGSTAACPRWPEEFWRDAIDRGGGGTCFESNYAFFSLLRTLGYAGYLTVNDMGEKIGCHTAIMLGIGEGRWLADVGLPLYAPLPLDSKAATQRASLYLTYLVRPLGDGRYEIERSPHPNPYCFTLVDRPVANPDYRAATTNDYGPNGFFLNRVIVNKVIAGAIRRFNSEEQPPHFEMFENGHRTDQEITADVPQAVARYFGMDEETVRAALEATRLPDTDHQ